MLIVKRSQTKVIHKVSSAHTAMKSKMTAIKPGWCSKSPSARSMKSQPAKSFLDSRCSRGRIWRRTATPETSFLRKWNKMNKQTNKINPSQSPPKIRRQNYSESHLQPLWKDPEERWNPLPTSFGQHLPWHLYFDIYLRAGSKLTSNISV